jgi:hypothetical protein
MSYAITEQDRRDRVVTQVTTDFLNERRADGSEVPRRV